MRRCYYAYISPTFAGPVCVVRAQRAPDGRKGVWPPRGHPTLAPLEFADEAAAVQWLGPKGHPQRRAQRAPEVKRGYVEVE
jgi:hypothetical protein